jgi:UDP-glucose 4-epimerase
MKILVTGGAGFIGSHLVDRLVSEGHTVSIVDNLSTGKKENVNKKAKLHKTDIENPELQKVFEETEPEAVFHLAAQTQVTRSMDDPLFDARTNILGTLNLLVLSLKYGVQKFIFSSSGGVLYGNTVSAATEDCPANPFSPYGLSKQAGEQYVRFYGQLGLNYTILRYSNVYGPRQDPYGEAGVVAIWSNLMLANEPCVLYGFGKLKRDYVYVEDIVRANVSALRRGENQAFNIGTGVPTSVKELFEEMSQAANYSQEPVHKPTRPGELEVNFLNCDKARKELGWEPKTKLSDGLTTTIQWFGKE